MPSALLPGLPFVFITNKMHVLSPGVLHSAQVPPDVQLTKIFLRTHVDQLADEFDSVKSLGGAAVEEWLKGLEGRGKKRRSNTSRWEKWPGIVAMRTVLYSGLPVAASSVNAASVSTEALSSTNGAQYTQRALLAPRASSSHKTSTPLANSRKYP